MGFKEGLKDTEENHSARFSNNDELKYSLRSAQMYAPWINKIFIITDNQVPQWLDVNHSKIKIIAHKEIMDENNLPCFNSNALETCLDKIPELSEYFLYANDDMFFSAPVFPEDFFDKDGNPVVNLRPRMWEKIQVDITTIDKFCEENNVYPDFIKMDIEGAEPSALKGGIKTIQKYRPQLAISIYHSDSDFIDIPLYLYENLENYTFHIEHYSPRYSETVLYAVPNELK